jgi:hypothetical protein
MTETHGANGSRQWFDIVTLVLAVLAIVFAIVQFVDSYVQKKELNAISDSMSTHFIGEFPKNILQITQVASQSTKTLDVMVDFPGYGHYSSPEEFKRYFRTLIDLRTDKRIAVRMLIYDAKLGSDSRNRQLRPSFEKRMQTTAFLHFFKDEHPGIEMPKNYDEFDQKMTELQKKYEQELAENGIYIRHTSTPLMFFLWLEDGEDAVFSFLNNEEGSTELSFRTRDSAFIRTFKDTFEQLWKASQISPIKTHPSS